MQHIYTFYSLALVLLNLAALSIVFRNFFPSYALARGIGLISISSIMFFIEHFVGLGSLHWIWPITSILSILILWKKNQL